ncbi:MAG TPA: DinB family protein [Candidatus Dormibacteraeota bacterium]|nr:DinB family protein [Candidatus Dormibacteraeota bacterium]
MTDFLTLSLRHNSWANQALLDFCAGLDPELLERRVPDNLRTIREALAHILGAEQRYLRALGHGLEGSPLMEPDDPTLEQLRALAPRLAAAWEQVAAAGVELEQEDTGPRGTTRLGIVLAQAVHHGSDHRSQICTTLGALGVEPPDLDLWTYGATIGWVRFPDQPGSR